MKKIRLIPLITIPTIFASAIVPLTSCAKKEEKVVYNTITFVSNDSEATFKGDTTIKVPFGTKWSDVVKPEVVLPEEEITEIGWYNVTEDYLLDDEQQHTVDADATLSYLVYSKRTKAVVNIVSASNGSVYPVPEFSETYNTIKGISWSRFYQIWQPELPEDKCWTFTGLINEFGSDIKGSDRISSSNQTARVKWDWVGPSVNVTLRHAMYKDGSITKTIEQVSPNDTWWDVLQIVNVGINPEQEYTLAGAQWIDKVTGKKLPTDETEAKKIKISEPLDAEFIALPTAQKYTIELNYIKEVGGTPIKYQQKFANATTTLDEVITSFGFKSDAKYLNYNLLGWFKTGEQEKLTTTKTLSELFPSGSGSLSMENRLEKKTFNTISWALLNKLIHTDPKDLSAQEKTILKQIINEQYTQPDGSKSWIGMERPIWLNGQQYNVRVVGFNHEYWQKQPTVKGITFAMTNAFSNADGDPYCLAWDKEANIQYHKSWIFHTLNQERNDESWYVYNKTTSKWERDLNHKQSVYKLFKEGNPELFNCIKTVSKRIRYFTTYAQKMSLDHKLFPLSSYEMIGHDVSEAGRPGNQENQYEYYKLYKPSKKSNLFKMTSLNGTPVDYWTRTVKTPGQYDAIAFTKNGSEPTDFDQHFKRVDEHDAGMVFGFCI